MNAILVRSALPDDLPVLLTYEQGIISAERPFDPTLKPDPISYYDIAAMIDAPHVEVAVALYENRIVGSGYARIEASKPYLRHDSHAYLGFMYVDDSVRGQGVNAKIIAHLSRWAKERGLTELRLDVYADNAPAVRAYEKVGFKRHLVEMRLGI